MENRIKNVMSAVFRVPVGSLGDAPSQGTLDVWDSLSHMQLVVALEEEFGVSFDDEDILQMQSLAEITAVLERCSGKG